MDPILNLGVPSATPPPTKVHIENLGLGLWFSTESPLKSPTQEHHNPSSSSNPQLQLGLPWCAKTSKNPELQSPPDGYLLVRPDFSLLKPPVYAASPGSGDISTLASDNEETGLSSAGKKLRLSKDQVVYLEESFKEQQTLNLKQKVELAKKLGLRPRQVEVWFQNRRARTKLKQTEVDCSFLKQSCEALTVVNRRLQKEISDLRALSVQPFNMLPPATTLSVCPNCERLSTAAAAGTTVSDRGKATSLALFLDKPGFFPFAGHVGTSHQSSAA